MLISQVCQLDPPADFIYSSLFNSVSCIICKLVMHQLHLSWPFGFESDFLHTKSIIVMVQLLAVRLLKYGGVFRLLNALSTLQLKQQNGW